MYFNRLEEQGLVKRYYAGRGFKICRIADWSIMVIDMVGEQHYDADGEEDYITYKAWYLDLDTAQKIIKNNTAFSALMTSKQTAREPDMIISTADGIEVLSAIKEEIRNGTRECMIDPLLEKELKGVHMDSIKPYVDLYGNPPKFTDKKYWAIMLSFFLYPLGLPWFLSGNKRGGFIMLGTMVVGTFLSIIFMPLIFVAMAFLVINVFVFYFKLFFGMIKDEKGLPVITKKRQKEIARMIELYNKYKSELGE